MACRRPSIRLQTLAIPEPSLVTLQAYDVSLIGAIEKAILASDLGLNPANDGRLIRIPIPPLNEERRQQLAKHVHKVLEHHRTAVRNIRRDGNETMKKHLKNKEMSEDDEHRALDDIQKLTDEYIRKLERDCQDQGRRNPHRLILPKNLANISHQWSAAAPDTSGEKSGLARMGHQSGNRLVFGYEKRIAASSEFWSR